LDKNILIYISCFTCIISYMARYYSIDSKISQSGKGLIMFDNLHNAILISLSEMDLFDRYESEWSVSDIWAGRVMEGIAEMREIEEG
jgi:hypothetical protein